MTTKTMTTPPPGQPTAMGVSRAACTAVAALREALQRKSYESKHVGAYLIGHGIGLACRAAAMTPMPGDAWSGADMERKSEDLEQRAREARGVALHRMGLDRSDGEWPCDHRSEALLSGFEDGATEERECLYDRVFVAERARRAKTFLPRGATAK